MSDVIQDALQAPIANVLVVFGLVFLGLSILGSVSKRFEMGRVARIISGLVGFGILLVGLTLTWSTRNQPSSHAPPSNFQEIPDLTGVWRATGFSWPNCGSDLMNVLQTGASLRMIKLSGCTPAPNGTEVIRGTITGRTSSEFEIIYSDTNFENVKWVSAPLTIVHIGGEIQLRMNTIRFSRVE